MALSNADKNVRCTSSKIQHISYDISRQGNIDLFAEFMLMRKAECLVESRSSFSWFIRLTTVDYETDGKCFAIASANCSREIIVEHIAGIHGLFS